MGGKISRAVRGQTASPAISTNERPRAKSAPDADPVARTLLGPEGQALRATSAPSEFSPAKARYHRPASPAVEVSEFEADEWEDEKLMRETNANTGSNQIALVSLQTPRERRIELAARKARAGRVGFHAVVETRSSSPCRTQHDEEDANLSFAETPPANFGHRRWHVNRNIVTQGLVAERTPSFDSGEDTEAQDDQYAQNPSGLTGARFETLLETSEPHALFAKGERGAKQRCPRLQDVSWEAEISSTRSDRTGSRPSSLRPSSLPRLLHGGLGEEPPQPSSSAPWKFRGLGAKPRRSCFDSRLEVPLA